MAAPAAHLHYCRRHQPPLTLVEQRQCQGEEPLQVLIADVHNHIIDRATNSDADAPSAQVVWAQALSNYTGSSSLVIDVVGYFTTEPDPGADVLQRAGDAPFFSYDTYALNDRLGAKVNLGTGNLMISTADMAVPVVGGSRVLGRTYNSLALAPGASNAASPLFGPAWRFSEAPDRQLRINANGTVTYLSGSGHATVFAASTLAAPAGVDASLVKNTDGTYTLTDIPSATVVRFRADGLPSSEVDRNANTIIFTYPGSGGYETSIAGNAGTAPGNTVNIAYEGPGKKVSAMTRTAGTTTLTVSYAYDASGYLHQVTDAGGATIFDYDPTTHNLITIIDPAGHVTRFTYDASRRVTSLRRVITGGDAVTTYDYTTPNQTTVSDANGNPPTTLTFLPDGRLKESLNARQVKSVLTWTPQQLTVDKVEIGDANANPLQTVLDDVWTLLTGSSAPDLTKVTSPTGAVSAAGDYGSGLTAHLPGWTTDTMGFQTSYSYDPKGNVASVKDPLLGLASVERNADGTVWKAYSPAYPTSNPTVYGYTNHQLTSVDPPGTDLGSTSATYDGFGRLKTSTSGQAMTTTFTYDPLDRVKTETHSDSTPTVSYNYDPAGNLLSRSDATGATTYTYDAANRPLTRTGGLSWTWYPAGNLKTATDPGGTTTYHYDILNRLDQVTEPASGRKTLYRYDIFGRRTDTWYNTGSDIAYLVNAVIPPGSFAAHTQATYDAAGQLTELKTTKASSDADAARISDLKYSYAVPTATTCPDATAGRPTSIRHTVTDVLAANQVTSYCYDRGGRLKTAATAGGPTYSYGFDANTNRTSGPEGAHTVNLVDQLTDSGFDYDDDGNLTTGGTCRRWPTTGSARRPRSPPGATPPPTPTPATARASAPPPAPPPPCTGCWAW